MSQPPVSGHDEGAEPDRDPELPDGSSGVPGPGQCGELRLGDFAKEGNGNARPPGPELAAVIAALSGPDGRCAGATDDELIGLLGRWAAMESRAVASKLGVVRELIRRRAIPVPGTATPGGLPELWEDSIDHEVAGALRISPQAAGKLTNLAWILEARLPGIGARLTDGTISSTRRQSSSSMS